MSGDEQRQLVYGTRSIPYTLRYEVRKTLGITVHPDLTVLVQAPVGTQPAEVETAVRRRARWIGQRLDDYARYSPDLPPREYVSGETHRYLGRQYRLKVHEGEPEQVQLNGPFLVLTVRTRSDRARAEALVQGWYRAQAREVFAARLEACYPRLEAMGVARPRLSVRAMRTRWGSASKEGGRITLNVKLVQVPTPLIDYVLFHELCHLAEPHHGRPFYQLLNRVLPDWQASRDRLNQYEFG